jgi:hypothetical protein
MNFKPTKDLLESITKVLDEGRGKKGQARHSTDEYDDEWGDKEDKKKKTIQRGGVREVEEEAEQIDELSKSTLGRYINKARSQESLSWYKQGNRSADSKDIRNVVKRNVGITKAVDKLTKEDIDVFVLDEDHGIGEIIEETNDSVKVLFDDILKSYEYDQIFVEDIEQIDELSKDTLLSYNTKAQSAIDSTKGKRGKPTKAVVALRAKRTGGLENTKKRLEAIYKKESDEHNTKMKGLESKLNDQFEKEHPAIMAKHGFEKIHSHPERDVYVHKHDNGHVSTVTINKPKNDSSFFNRHDIRATNTKGSSWSNHNVHNGVYREGHYDKHTAEMMPRFEKHLIDVKDSTNNSHW